jgi:ribonuclease P/MRP protein subunit RPP40
VNYLKAGSYVSIISVLNHATSQNQCLKAAKTENCVLGIIKRTFNCLSKEVLLPLDKSLAWPHLVFGIQVWRPYLRKDIDLLEGVQRRATKIIFSLKFKSYKDRLKELKLTTLKTRRLRESD